MMKRYLAAVFAVAALVVTVGVGTASAAPPDMTYDSTPAMTYN